MADGIIPRHVLFGREGSTLELLGFLLFPRMGSLDATYQLGADTYQIANGNFVAVYRGSGFTYNGTTLVGGTVENLTFQELTPGGAVRVFSLNAVSLSVGALNALDQSDVVGFQNLVFGGNDFMDGSPEKDFMAMGPGNDSGVGAAGPDTILGNQGDDVILGNPDNDIVVGGQGADTVVGGQGLDVVFGNEANDLIFGNEADDTVFAGQGDDNLFAGQGNDLIFGNQGNDTMAGNEGADRFVFSEGDGADRILGFNQAEGDRMEVFGPRTVTAGANGAIINYNGGTIELVGIAAASVNGTFFV